MKKTAKIAALLAMAGGGMAFGRRAYHPNSANGWHGLAPRREVGGMRVAPPPPPRHDDIVINKELQPWQKHAMKLAMRRARKAVSP